MIHTFKKVSAKTILTAMPDFFYNNKLYYNPVEFAMDRIGGTWKMPILWRLKDKVMRYGELKKDIPHITHKMLTSQLRELEEEGFIKRKVYAVVPPKVEYSITTRGKRAVMIVDIIRNYGLELMKEFGVEENKNTGTKNRK
ncbi:HxlR family transcriptional regulator [Sediminibacterium goheungense]|uniref:HxlR family transcriptional regulator n=2 Tax=Sediminibacterium goheungense TaxID=1086393 RepID=A0A4R6J299_9BACT|nr:HxlR family transcriptional regulator [Sediminibacterium goheungense]